MGAAPMTLTREQMEAEVFDCAEALSGVVNTIDGDYCAWHTAPAAQVIVERLRKLAAALAPQGAAPMPPIEVRIAKLDDGTEEFDEVCAGACQNVHLEKMTDQMFALMIYTDRETACFHIFTKNGRAHIDAREAWRETEPPNGNVWRRP